MATIEHPGVVERAGRKLSDDYLTTQDVQDELHVGGSTLRGWRMRGYGPPWIRIGDLIRYPKSALEAWLAANTQRERNEADRIGGEVLP